MSNVWLTALRAIICAGRMASLQLVKFSWLALQTDARHDTAGRDVDRFKRVLLLAVDGNRGVYDRASASVTFLVCGERDRPCWNRIADAADKTQSCKGGLLGKALALRNCGVGVCGVYALA